MVRRGEEERKTGDRWMERSEKEEMEDKREKKGLKRMVRRRYSRMARGRVKERVSGKGQRDK